MCAAVTIACRPKFMPQHIAQSAQHTERLGFLIAHRPGFVAPTLAARKIATFDHLTDGRIALHVISGASDDGVLIEPPTCAR